MKENPLDYSENIYSLRFDLNRVSYGTRFTSMKITTYVHVMAVGQQ